jgi:hypothetical protein
MMGQFWEISTTNSPEYGPRMDANRRGGGARSRDETFAGAAVARWLGCIRVVANHASRRVRLKRLSGWGVIRSVLIRVYSCPFAVVFRFVVGFAVGGHAIR